MPTYQLIVKIIMMTQFFSVFHFYHPSVADVHDEDPCMIEQDYLWFPQVFSSFLIEFSYHTRLCKPLLNQGLRILQHRLQRLLLHLPECSVIEQIQVHKYIMMVSANYINYHNIFILTSDTIFYLHLYPFYVGCSETRVHHVGIIYQGVAKATLQGDQEDLYKLWFRYFFEYLQTPFCDECNHFSLNIQKYYL